MARQNLKLLRKTNPESPLGTPVLGSHLKGLVLPNGKLSYARPEEAGKSQLLLTRVIRSLNELILVSLTKDFFYLE